MTLLRACAVAASAVLLGSCSIGLDCTTSGIPAVRIFVRDADTRDPRVLGTLGTLTEGTYVDTMQIMGFASDGVANVLGGAVDRPGTYRVKLVHAGYADWVTDSAKVEAGACGVIPLEFEALLTVPTPAASATRR